MYMNSFPWPKSHRECFCCFWKGGQDFYVVHKKRGREFMLFLEKGVFFVVYGKEDILNVVYFWGSRKPDLTSFSCDSTAFLRWASTVPNYGCKCKDIKITICLNQFSLPEGMRKLLFQRGAKQLFWIPSVTSLTTAAYDAISIEVNGVVNFKRIQIFYPASPNMRLIWFNFITLISMLKDQ